MESIKLVENIVNSHSDSDSSEDDQDWGDWEAQNDDVSEDNDFNSKLVCLFCNAVYDTADSLFQHCTSVHHFDFNGIKKRLDLDFYSCFKLINYVRSKVAEHKCWSCGITCQSNDDLLDHLHKDNYDGSNFPWNEDIYLKPYMEEDAVLYSFAEADEAEEDDSQSFDKKEIMRELGCFNEITISDDEAADEVATRNTSGSSQENGTANVIGNGSKSLADAVTKINKNYFDSYSSFSIHREMISDKVRTDAYRQAIMENPSLLKGSVVMDVGCGTGILSLFAAQSGASRVFAVEASERMAGFAKQIAKDNGFGAMEIVQGMIEDLDGYNIPQHSVDVLISEWMGYCLLYESMLSSVLFARDRWLKPGGAILPDTATMFIAGFGKGGTSIPFWEEVYGFDMSCIGKEVVEDSVHFPIVDVLDSREIVTETEILQSFDLSTMKIEDMDFTAQVTLKPVSSGPKTSWCYGLVLWFDTGFTNRFCKENPIVLSTSPYAPPTHWCQTILTFKEPIAITSEKHTGDISPAVSIHSRISVVRAIKHRSIDISMELVGIGPDGQKRNYPAQLFNLN